MMTLPLLSPQTPGKMKSVMRTYVELLDRWLEENGFQIRKYYIAVENTAVISVQVVNNSTIQVVNNAKFLGVTFNSKLRWAVQVKENEQSGHYAALNIMKTLGHIKWGTNQDVIRSYLAG
jgi:hypothetical protein